MDHPIITLCGSVRLGKETWDMVAQDLALQGCVVLTVNVWGAYNFLHSPDGEETKKILDAAHKKKIELSDQVCVLIKDGYLGDSTKSEMLHAEKYGVPVAFIDLDHYQPFSIISKGGRMP